MVRVLQQYVCVTVGLQT